MSLSLGSVKMNLAVGIQNLIIYELYLNDVDNKQYSYWIDGYQNCREQGVSIFLVHETGITKSVTISEAKGCNNIVVYLDNRQFQGVSDESYKNSKHFNRGEYSEAVKFCVDHLLS